MRRLGRLLWEWSWLPAVCFLAAFAVWAQRTAGWFLTFGLERDLRPAPVTLAGAGQRQLDLMLRSLRLQLQRRAAPAGAARELRALQLFVAAADLSRLDRDLPYSGQDNVDALLQVDGKVHEVKLRYRGDNMLQWADAKKSLRLRTRKDELVLGMRSLLLLAPRTRSQIDGHVGLELAARLGLLAPHSELVTVYLNGRYHGLYQLQEQLDEGTLRKHDRMPGDLYAGEATGGDAVGGADDLLFGSAALWQKLAANNHYPLDSRAPLQALLAALNAPADAASMQRLGELVDLDAFARLSLLEQLLGAAGSDQRRNWRLFWDPWRRRFEPVACDPAATGVQQGGEPPVPSSLHARLFAHGGFLRARSRAAAELVAGEVLPDWLAAVDRAAAAATAAIAADPNAAPADDLAIGGAIADLQRTAAAAVAALRRDGAGLDGPGGDGSHGRVPLRWQPPASADGPLCLQVDTPHAVDGIELAFAAPMPALPLAGATLRLLDADGSEPVPLGERCRPTAAGLRLDLALVAARAPQLARCGDADGLQNQRWLLQPTSYELRLPGVDLRRVAGVRWRGAGEAVPPAAFAAAPVRSLYAALPAPPPAPLQLQGELDIDGVREFQAPVRIAAGTRFRLGPGACLLFHGPVLAEGTALQPIAFAPRDRDQDPWGTVALDGDGCSGSRLRHCRFVGGSGHKSPLAEYTAMLSVHGARDVAVSDCEFRDSKVTDDMIHTVYAQVTFTRVLLQRALMDALDCDISDVLVQGSRFVDSGNDGVDLMTTRAVVVDCSFDRCGDKGISIGEDTQLCVVGGTFDGCHKAMEAKDASVAAVLGADVRACELALNAYRKNWRYDGGGSLTVHRSTFAGNRQMPTADHASRIELRDCRLDAPLPAKCEVDGKPERNRAAAIGCDDGAKARSAAVPFPAGLASLRPLAEPFWRAAAGAPLRGSGR